MCDKASNEERHIEFFIPEKEIIPLRLRLKVDGVDVYYWQKPGLDIVYRFRIFEQDITKCKEIIEDLARMIRMQSYDHGVYWKVEEITDVEAGALSNTFDVKFRIRDGG